MYVGISTGGLEMPGKLSKKLKPSLLIMNMEINVRSDVKEVLRGERFSEDQYWGFSPILECSWEELVGHNSSYFIDGIMEVQVKLSFSDAIE